MCKDYFDIQDKFAVESMFKKSFFLKFYETKELFKSDTIFRSSRPEMLYQKRDLKNTFAGMSF